MGHKVKVNGTVYEVKGGKTKVNGTAYSIKGGKTKVGGTGYSINFFPPPSSHTPGDIITWDNKKWLVCHYDSSTNRVYLITSDTVDNCKFNTNGSSTYAGSILAARCTTYQNESMSTDALNMCVDVTVDDVTAKVFVPGLVQMQAETYPNQGFSWFNSDSHREVAGAMGYYAYYWTSSAYSSRRVYRVYNGSLGNTTTNTTHGFRPCVCVQL